jgi:hypothetical protein
VAIDNTAPTVSSIATTDGDGKFEQGDTLVITFTEAMTGAPVGSGVVNITETTGGTLTISGITNGANTLGANNYVGGSGNKSVTSTGSVALTSGSTVVRITVDSPPTGNGSAVAGGPGVFAYSAASTLVDLAGNQVSAPFSTGNSFKLF